jgi:hypothetical protein
MTEQLPGLAFSVNSTADFARPEFAQAVLDVLLRQDSAFVPTLYSRYPPASTALTQHVEDAVNIWTNAGGRTGYSPDIASGGIALQSALGTRYQVSWENSADAAPPSIAGTVPSKLVRTVDVLARLRELVEQLTVVTNAFYGEVRAMTPGWDLPFNFRARLPDIPWFSSFGPPLVDHFGKPCLLSTPVLSSQEFSPGFVSLLVAPSPFDKLAERTKEDIRRHLGDENFMSGGKWRYSTGTLPHLELQGLRSSAE